MAGLFIIFHIAVVGIAILATAGWVKMN